MLLFALLSVATLSGCGAVPQPDEEHHSEAVDLTFVDSVAMLRRYSMNIDDMSSNSHDTPTTERLIELIEKLPVLAADTDLKKSDWDRVHSISQKLQSIVKHQASPPDQATTDAMTMAPLVGELERIASLIDAN